MSVLHSKALNFGTCLLKNKARLSPGTHCPDKMAQGDQKPRGLLAQGRLGLQRRRCNPACPPVLTGGRKIRRRCDLGPDLPRTIPTASAQPSRGPGPSMRRGSATRKRSRLPRAPVPAEQSRSRVPVTHECHRPQAPYTEEPTTQNTQPCSYLRPPQPDCARARPQRHAPQRNLTSVDRCCSIDKVILPVAIPK